MVCDCYVCSADNNIPEILLTKVYSTTTHTRIYYIVDADTRQRDDDCAACKHCALFGQLSSAVHVFFCYSTPFPR